MLASAANAKPKVTAEVQVVARHEHLVTFSWDVKVVSERAWDACDLIISFQDQQGQELYVVKQTLTLKEGSSKFSGYEICETEKWKRIRKYVATLDCVF